MMNSGITVFPNVLAAIRAGYQIESPYVDSEGFIHARTRTASGWARALVRP